MSHQVKALQSAFTFAVALTVGISTVATAQDVVRVPLDAQIKVNGVDVACTGIGQTKDDRKWLAYPVRVEFAEPGGAYLADETLSLATLAGKPVLSVHCGGPWILLKLPAGQAYRATGKVEESGTHSHAGVIQAPAHGQKRFVLAFANSH